MGHFRYRARGAASVEAAISMLLIVPVFLYALFLDDLLRYAGDLQEAVTSTPWDFTGQDYTRTGTRGLGKVEGSAPPGGQTAVQWQARLMFCDHESSGDSYEKGQDCGAQDHHAGKALSGHVCWLNAGARQVTCEPVQTDVGLLKEGQFRQYQAVFGTAGGMYECHARSVVENYLMPKSFLQRFSKVDLAKKNWKSQGSDYHENATQGTDETAYFLEAQHFSLVTDPWALNGDLKAPNPGDTLAVRPGDKRGELYERVNHVYTRSPAFAALAAADALFRTAASEQELLAPGAKPDDPLDPNVSLQKTRSVPPTQAIQEEKRSVHYFATPWKDWSRDAYEKTAHKRGAYYLGCKNPEAC
jgi:hypothetical protein